MKLSAKWLTALAALALFAVVMVGIQERGAEAATTGQIYLTNKYTNLTTESGPSKADYDPDRAYVGSGTSLYSTVLTGTWDDDENEILDDNIENSIRDDANVVIITVVDPDADVATDSTPLAVATDVPSRATITVPLNNAGSDGPPVVPPTRIIDTRGSPGGLRDDVRLYSRDPATFASYGAAQDPVQTAAQVRTASLIGVDTLIVNSVNSLGSQDFVIIFNPQAAAETDNFWIEWSTSGENWVQVTISSEASGTGSNSDEVLSLIHI